MMWISNDFNRLLKGKNIGIFLATKMKIWTDLKGKVVDLSSKRGGQKRTKLGKSQESKNLRHKWTIIEFVFSGRIYRFFHVFPMTYGGFQ